ncbi:DUF979 domain-containing protein [Telluria aromaticivorans]|uniref:DUF979 domain-containing protein n=1 Tax=Telluria aromaticivorans TaxID=2725995 RepID=A0A7Y2P1K8_9BURK|nr:DUF979 domain-containing protein [Telluria aromaticivorans]NNG25344.1 DUF979 domain-containing protein [Telluria aromaticivorans]
MITLEFFYVLVGLLFVAVAVMNLVDRSNPRRYTTALFWGLYALLYLAGERLPPAFVGALMILMALVAGFKGVTAGKPATLPEEARRESSTRLGNRLFIPALLLPLVTMVGATLFKDVQLGGLPLLDPKHVTLVSLGCAAIVALGAACWLTRSTPLQGVREARRLVDAMSWAVVLPHMLAVLGLLFTEAGVGKAVAHVTTSYIDMDSRFIAVAVFCIGMALFTIVMGNGFAAFPVMAGGVGIPVLVGVYGANPAVMAAIGMFSAYCGTLMTPMAANFNIVPAALLDLPDKNAVIRAQVPTALPLLVANIFLLYFLMNQ